MYKLVKSTIIKSSWSYYVLVLNVITGIIHTGLLARALGPGEYGKYHVILSFCALTMGTFSFLASEALIPYATKYRNNGDNENLVRTIKSTITLTYLTSIFGFILFIIILFIVPKWSGISEGEIIFGVLVGFTGIAGANIYSYMNILRVFENFSIYFKQALIFDSFKILIVSTLYYFNFGLMYYIIGLLIRQIFQSIYYDYYTRKIVGQHLGHPVNNLFTKKIIVNREEKRFFSFNFLSAKIRTLSLHLDKVLVNILLNNPSVVGLYSAAKRIMQIAELSFSNLSTAIIPQLASDFIDNKKYFIKNILIQTGLVCLVGFPIIGIIMLFIEDIITLWMGDAFVNAAPITQIMLLTVLIKVFPFVITYLPSAVGDAKAKFIGLTVGLICYLVIILFSYNVWGVMSFAYALFGSTLSYSLVMFLYSIKIINQNRIKIS